MKRCLMLFMTVALLIFSLAACGCSAQQAGNESGSGNQNSSQNGSDSQNNSGSSQNNGGMGSGSGSAGNGTDSAPSTPPYDENGNVIDDAIDGITGAVDDVGDAITGNNTHDTTGGVSYEQMLRNGRVHDRDGNLKDGENSSVNTGR